MNLGSPDSTSVRDVKKYLDEFLMDGRVIDQPWLIRSLLVKGIITPFRSPRSAKAYSTIWTDEGSPLIVFTKQLQHHLQQQLEEPVEVAMRYGKPGAKEAYESLLKKLPGLEEVLLVPLYPHYAMSSYETAVEHMKTVHRKKKYSFSLTTVKPFYDQPDYLEALAENIRPYLDQEFDKILFSYHGIPERHVIKTDVTRHHCLQSPDCCEKSSPAHAFCYRHQVITTTKLITEILGIPPEKYSLSFQSRLGRDKWLEPYTAKRLTELPAEGVKRLLIVCPAFVSDCLETLEEIAGQGRESFLHSGGASLTLIPCLNVHPLWVRAIAGWVKQYAEGSREMVLE